MTMYKTNNPNYIKDFDTFDKSINNSEIKKIRKSKIKNNIETKQMPGNKSLYFNKITKKMDDVSLLELDDMLMPTVDESIDYKYKYTLTNTKDFSLFEEKAFDLIQNLISSLEENIEFDPDNKEEMITLKQAMIEIIEKF